MMGACSLQEQVQIWLQEALGARMGELLDPWGSHRALLMGVRVVGWARYTELSNTALYKPDRDNFQFILSMGYYNRSIF